MSTPSPNQPRNLFPNTPNDQNEDPNPPPSDTSVEPSPITVLDHCQNASSSTAPNSDVLGSPSSTYQLDHLIDVALASQSPMASESKYKVSANPTQASPDVNNVRVLDDEDNTRITTKRKRKHARNMGSTKLKKNKATVNPAKSMLLFLREPYISNYVSTYETSEKARGPSTNNNTKSVINSWKRNYHFSWGPFSSLKDQLSNAPDSIAFDHNRLLLEDIMLLEKGQSIRFLISSDHRMFKKKTLNKQFQTNLTDCLSSNPLKPRTFKNKIYFACDMTVASNVNRDDFAQGILTVDDFKRMCTSEYGAGIMFKMNNNFRHLFKFSEILECSESMLFYSNSPIQRIQYVKKVMRDVKDKSRLGGIAARMMDEYFGDKAGFISVSNHYDKLMMEADMMAQFEEYKNAPISSKRFMDYLELDEQHEPFVAFRNDLDAHMKSSIDELYGNFSEFTSPLVSQETIAKFADQFKTSLPIQYTSITVLINKHRMKRSRTNDACDAERDQFVFYLFCIMMRIRNNRNLTWWAMCNAAATFTDAGKNLSVYFGISTSQRTMKNKLNDIVPYDKILTRTTETLAQYDFGISIFDNSQMFTKKKFQRNGISSSSTIVTSRCFIKPTIPSDIDDIDFGDTKAPLTYLDQPIPSPPHMKAFETLDPFDARSYLSTTPTASDLDCSGNRVNAYAKMAMTASIVSKLVKIVPRHDKRFAFMHPKHQEAMETMRIPFRLKDNCYKVLPEYGRTFYRAMGLFQHNATKSWLGDVAKCSMIVPPISNEDETTKKGAAKVILSLIALFGIMKGQDHEGVHGNVRSMELSENYKTRYLVIVGDGLSQMRARTFNDIIEDSSYNFGAQHEMTVKVTKSLQQVIHVPGDLHGGCFHFLSAIYSLYYGALIQPIQALVGWKRIKGTDVTKCYQQAAGLAIMIASELEKNLLNAYMHEVWLDGDATTRMNEINNPNALALAIADGYQTWLDEKIESSTDQYLVMVISYVKLMEMYRLFRLSIRAGDAIMIEWLYSRFLPIYIATGKTQYVEIVLSMMESFYKRIPSKILHLVRVNRTCPLYAGVDKQGDPMAFWAHDAIIELLQKYFHQHNKENTIESWIQNSPHLMFMNKAKRMVQTEFGREKTSGKESKFLDQADDRGEGRDKNKNKKRTFVPNRDLEKKIISEFILLLKITEETPNRKYESKVVWNVIQEDKIQTKLIVETENDRAVRLEYETMTVEEQMLSDYAEELIDAASGVDSDGNRIETNEDTVEFDPATMIPNGRQDNNENETEQPSERVIVKSRKINLTKAKLNMLAFQNIFKVGEDEMRKRNYVVVRLMKMKRKERNLAMRKHIYNEVSNENQRSPTVDEFFKRYSDST